MILIELGGSTNMAQQIICKDDNSKAMDIY